MLLSHLFFIPSHSVHKHKRQHGILRFLTLFVPCQTNHQNTQSKIRNVTAYIFGMNIVVKREVSKQFDGSIQVVFCHEALLHKIFQWVIVPLWLYSSTFAMGSIGARRLLRFSVWTAWHATSSKRGIFLEVCCFQSLSCDHFFSENNDPSFW